MNFNITEFVDNYLGDIPKPNIDFANLANIFKPSEDNVDHRERALKLEEKILALSGLCPGRDINIYDVSINHNGPNYIHTIECGKKNKETLVLLHGYSGSLTLFYPMLKELSKRYHVYCIDFLGMGLSSRPEFNCTTSQEAVQYFVSTFEKWRKAVGIRKYYLGGHSFGGYIASAIAYKNRNGLKGLFLMSPIGVGGTNENGISEEWAEAMGWAKTNFWTTYFQVYCKFHEEKITPNELVKKFSPFASFFIKKYMAGLLNKNQPESAADLLGEFLFEMLMIPGGSEQAVHCILKPPRICAEFPLEKVVFNQISDIPVYCYYGEDDWNDWSGAQRFSKLSQKKNFKFDFIPKSGHQVTLQNPEEIVEKMLIDLRA